MSALEAILSRVRERGPITVAEYMDIALYDAGHGYYAQGAQRSGRGGDFFTSVDVSPLFGEMLAVQFEEMWRLHLGGPAHIDIVEAGAGNGRLSRDVLDAVQREHPEFYRAISLWEVERSSAARQAAVEHVLEPHQARIAGSGAELPQAVRGIIFANELLDAMPAHAVVMRAGGLREIYVAVHEGRLVEVEGPLSDPVIARQIDDSGVSLPEGARAEVSLAAVRWVDAAARALTSGFLLLIDYGRPGAELFSAHHPRGTLMTYRQHVAGAGHWLQDPGRQDLTTHVDLTAVRRAAEGAGLHTIGMLDQTYFLASLGLADRLEGAGERDALNRRLAAKTLMLPGALGSTMKVMLFARDAGATLPRGFTSGRLT